MANYVKITVPTGKIRQEPKPDGRVLLELKAGQEVELLEQQRRYSKVRYKDHFQDVTGWLANVAINLPDEMSDVEAMAHPTCPFCGSRTWIERGVATAGGRALAIGGFFGHHVHSRVCLGCGYVQLHVSQSSLEQLREQQEQDGGA